MKTIASLLAVLLFAAAQITSYAQSRADLVERIDRVLSGNTADYLRHNYARISGDEFSMSIYNLNNKEEIKSWFKLSDLKGDVNVVNDYNGKYFKVEAPCKSGNCQKVHFGSNGNENTYDKKSFYLQNKNAANQVADLMRQLIKAPKYGTSSYTATASSSSSRITNPGSYYGVSSSQKTVVFEEQFTSNYRGWPTDSDRKVTNGVYRLKKTGDGTNSGKKPVPFDQTGNFEIESRVKFVKGTTTTGHWMTVGGNSSNEYFYILFSGNQKYRIGKREDKKYVPLKDWTKDETVSAYGYNKLTFRKVGNRFYYFINGKKVYEMAAQPLYGDYLGMVVGAKSTIEVDYFKISRINGGPSATASTYKPSSTTKSSYSASSGSLGNVKSYYGVSSSKKHIIFEETFGNNNRGWPETSADDHERKVINGVYRMQKKAEKGTKSAQMRVPIDDSKDYEIEARVKFVTGKVTTGHWMSFGGDDDRQYYYLLFNGDKEYRIGKRENKEYVPFKDWTDDDVLSKYGYNKLTVRKANNRFYFFINEKMVYDTYSRPLFGDYLGMVVGSSSTIEVDYLKVYMLGDDAPAPVFVSNGDPKKIVEEYANIRLKAWAKKDEFEKTVDYQARVSDANLQKKAKEFQEEKLKELKNEVKVNYTRKAFTLEAYDADNETYLVNGPDRQYVIPIPLDVARLVKTSFASSTITKQDFILTNDGLKLSTFTLKVPSAGSFTWDHLQDNPYQSTDVTYNITDVGFGIETVEMDDNPNIRTKKLTVGKSDVDVNIPSTGKYNPDAIAVVIGNSRYMGDVPSVDFAEHDAQVMKEYLEKTFGYKPGNILFESNASLSQMRVLFGDERNKGKLHNYVKAGRSDVFVFYSGHGAPDTNTKTGYLMPVDADPTALAITGYSIETLYDNLSQLNAKSVQVVIDACFSGGSSSGRMLINQASPIGIQVKNPAAKLGNGVIVTASQGDQISSWYAEKSHGLFTYFYLKGLRGDADLNYDKRITSGEMKKYLQDQTEGVPYWARRLHSRDQTPEVYSGSDQVIIDLN